MEQTKYKQYADIKLQIRFLEERAEELNKEIVADMQDNKVEKVETEFGKFTICTKKTWKFSPKVKSLEEKVKLAKIDEQERGIAKAEESNYLLFKENVTE